MNARRSDAIGHRAKVTVAIATNPKPLARFRAKSMGMKGKMKAEG
jgi:hypothetical protein